MVHFHAVVSKDHKIIRLNVNGTNAQGDPVSGVKERPCFSSGRKSTWIAGAVSGTCRAVQPYQRVPAGNLLMNGIETVATHNGVGAQSMKPTYCSLGLG